jgi:hypothetical protein
VIQLLLFIKQILISVSDCNAIIIRRRKCGIARRKLNDNKLGLKSNKEKDVKKMND